MDKNEAKKQLMENGRFNFKVSSARKVCEAFGLELDESLIRTTRGYREEVRDPTEPRVSVSTLAKNIAERLGVKPDNEKLKHANAMFGEGSHRDLKAQAYAMNL